MANRIRALLAASALAAVLCFAQSCARKGGLDQEPPRGESQTYKRVLPAETIEHRQEPASFPASPASPTASPAASAPATDTRIDEGPSYPMSIIDRY